MLEPIIAVVCLIIGAAAGWWARVQFASNTVAAPAEDAEKVARLKAELRTARESEVESRTRLDNLQTRFEEEKRRLAEIRAEMENAFKAMAADIARNNAETFLKQAGEQFKALKRGSEQDLEAKKKLIDNSLSGMNEKLEFIHKQSTALKASIDTSTKHTEALREDTTRLREILSSSQKRGQWGERMVSDILQFVGLVERVNYTRQSQVESGQRPDYTFNLPQEKKLNMDVKFPLAQYETYLAADTDAARESAKNAFLSSVRGHIKSVSGREYINPAEGTLDYVMLFIPNESIYGFINREDAELIDYALRNRVLLCSPLTLYAVLSLIHQAARNFTMNERASEVMQLVEQFRRQWQKYVEQMDKLGRRIEGLTGDFQTLVTTRTRALEKPLDRIENLSQVGDEIAADAAPALAE